MPLPLRPLRAGLTLLAVLVFVACASTPANLDLPPAGSGTLPLPATPDQIAESAKHRLWARKLPGYITDLSLAANGKGVLIATAPNRDRVTGARKYGLAWYSGDGKVRWEVQPDAPVRVLAMADDASLAVVSTYDEKITAYDPRGKVLWKVDALCRPILFPQSKRVVCYHDDDAEPRVAFDVFDWSGKKLSSYSIVQDILALKASDDEHHVVLGMTEGQVVLFGPKFHNQWQRRVEGEILDLDVSGGEHARVAVLHSPEAGRKQISFLGESGKSEGHIAAPSFAQRIEFASSGRHLVLYGGDAQGQDVAVWELAPAPGLATKNGAIAERWRHHEPKLSDTPPQFLIHGKEVVFVAGQDPLRIWSYGVDGKLQWNIPVGPQLITEEAAGLYAYAYSAQAHLAIVATDEGGLAAFRTLDPRR